MRSLWLKRLYAHFSADSRLKKRRKAMVKCNKAAVSAAAFLGAMMLLPGAVSRAQGPPSSSRHRRVRRIQRQRIASLA